MLEVIELLFDLFMHGKWLIGVFAGFVVGSIFTYLLFDHYNFIFVIAMTLVGAGIQFFFFKNTDK